MARAKNTDRAEARRKYRAARAAELGVPVEEVQEATLVTGSATAAAPAAEERRPGFRFPDVRGDLRALPGVIRSRRLLWLVLLLPFIALGIVALVGNAPIDASNPLATVAGLLYTIILAPPAYLPPFMAGFLAPRGSYLLGGLVGLLTGIVLLILNGQELLAAPSAALYVIGLPTIVGVLAGAFGAWYRTLFRRNQERARAAKLQREARLAAQRKEAKRQERQARQPSR